MIFGVRAGQLRHHVVIEYDNSNGAQDSAGEPTPLWLPWAERTVGIDVLQGRELERAKQIVAECSHKITMRPIKGLSPLHRFVFNGRVFNVSAVLNTQERNREIIVYAVEQFTYRENQTQVLRLYDFPKGGVEIAGSATT